MIKINNELLHQLSLEAKKSDRLRMNYNFHEELGHPVQRLLNVLEPDHKCLQENFCFSSL